jgi:hypothetical protein
MGGIGATSVIEIIAVIISIIVPSCGIIGEHLHLEYYIKI